MVIALILIGYFADIYTKHEYRSGFRIKSQDHLESGDDPLLIKFEGQADIVGRQGCKFNYLSPFFIVAGCLINPADKVRITLAAQNASAHNILADFGYKIYSDGKVCYINQKGNTTVRSSGNLYAL
jgi:hypothetical protein